MLWGSICIAVFAAACFGFVWPQVVSLAFSVHDQVPFLKFYSLRR